MEQAPVSDARYTSALPDGRISWARATYLAPFVLVHSAKLTVYSVSGTHIMMPTTMSSGCQKMVV